MDDLQAFWLQIEERLKQISKVRGGNGIKNSFGESGLSDFIILIYTLLKLVNPWKVLILPKLKIFTKGLKPHCFFCLAYS